MGKNDPVETAYIALGANLGDRRQNISRAMQMLAQTPGILVKTVSDLLETQAVGGPPGSPAYLNGAAELLTLLSPFAVLDRLLEVEAEIGRQRIVKWEPRVIDLDLLLYGQAQINTSKLQVPHPLMHTRRFVLEPLAQIAPNVVHPGLNQTVCQLLSTLTSKPGNVE